MRIAVVAAAIIVDGRVLAARRTRPAAVAGGWEFPGGKVEPGEDPAHAVERECREELGIGVAALDRIATAVDERISLELWRARLLAGTPSPQQDHDRLRWLTRTELADVAWLPIDRELLGPVASLLP